MFCNSEGCVDGNKALQHKPSRNQVNQDSAGKYQQLRQAQNNNAENNTQDTERETDAESFLGNTLYNTENTEQHNKNHDKILGVD